MSINQFLKQAIAIDKRKSKVKEISHEDKFCNFAKTKGCWPLKLVILNKRGFLDRTVLCPGGRVCFIEFKRTESQDLTAGQVKIKTKLEQLGFKCFKCSSFELARDALEGFLNEVGT